MGNACIATKNKQGAYLVAEKWAGCILSCGKMGKGAFWTAEKQTGHCALLKMLKGNTSSTNQITST